MKAELYQRQSAASSTQSESVRAEAIQAMIRALPITTEIPMYSDGSDKSDQSEDNEEEDNEEESEDEGNPDWDA